jgi:xylulose-5-phosphate/fructose-6-phosphate phosphoketolase
MKTKALDPGLLHKMNAYWRAANYLSVGQIYLYDNPLLKKPLKLEHVKPRLLGHWGTTPGLNFIYVHLNRVIKQYDLNVIYVTGPGHGGPALVANTYLEGTYSELYPNIPQDEAGMKKLFTQFSFPGGIPSHVAPETPGSINEGGELGYSLAHAYGAAFDNPDLLVACVVGDGEAETGPLATSWHSNKFLNPVHDGAVLPILHLNGYKIAGPTVLARISREELEALFRGYGYTPHFVEGDDPEKNARPYGGHPRHDRGRHSTHPARRSNERVQATPALADDHPALAEGLDRSGRGRWQTRRRNISSSPGAGCGAGDQAQAPEDSRTVDAELPAPGIIRPERQASRGTG